MASPERTQNANGEKSEELTHRFRRGSIGNRDAVNDSTSQTRRHRWILASRHAEAQRAGGDSRI